MGGPAGRRRSTHGCPRSASARRRRSKARPPGCVSWPARAGSQAALSGAPYGYRYVKKTEHTDAFYEIDEAQAEVVREVYRRYVEDGESISRIARSLTEEGTPTATGKAFWERSTVWRIL